MSLTGSETLQAGSYIILALGFAPGQTGSYQLSVRVAPACSPLGVLELGQTVTGALESDDCLFEFGGLMDNWSLNIASTRKLRLDLKSSDFDEILLVRDQQGNIMNGADAVGPTGHAQLETELSAGEWTISVASPFEAARGAYSLTVDVAPPCTPGTDLVLGETVEGEISPSDCLFEGYMPADSFGIKLTEETAVSFLLKSTDFDPLVILRDENGMDVAVAFAETQGGSARINTSLAPGSYALFATGYPSQGSYRLTVIEIACDDLQAIDFGQTVSGTLDADDCLRPGGGFQESWELVLANDRTARIDLESDAFDAFLVLKDSDGNILTTNDDGGSGLNARIDRALTAGTYQIVASSFGAGQTGTYRLTVDVPAATVPGRVRTAPTEAPRPKIRSAPDSGIERLMTLKTEYEAFKRARSDTSALQRLQQHQRRPASKQRSGLLSRTSSRS